MMPTQCLDMTHQPQPWKVKPSCTFSHHGCGANVLVLGEAGPFQKPIASFGDFTAIGEVNAPLRLTACLQSIEPLPSLARLRTFGFFW